MKRKATKKAAKNKQRKKTAKKSQEPQFIREIQIKLKRKRAPKGSKPSAPITSPNQVVELFRELQEESKEKFISISLDARRKIQCFEVVAIGSVNAVYFRPIEVLRPGIPYAAHGFIVLHNHPSGDPQPSKEDIALTKELKWITQKLGCRLWDHIIIGDGSFYSFAEETKILE